MAAPPLDLIGGPLGRSPDDDVLGDPPPETRRDARKKPKGRIKDRELVQYLNEMFEEARRAREEGPDARKRQWERNVAAYWSRRDHSDKADWQARERLPDVANFVERFAAAMRAALTSAGAEWFQMIDPRGQGQGIEGTAKKIMDAVLGLSGENKSGQPTTFAPVFASGIRLGALKKPAFSVLWKDGRCRIEVIDASEVFHDPSGKNLYRFRRYELDAWELRELAQLRDRDDKNLYNKKAVERAIDVGGQDEEGRSDKRDLTGESKETNSLRRKPVLIHEFLGTILDRDGKLVGKNQLVVMANHQEIIRGPETNPFWHGRDWIVTAPMIDMPLSVDGRSYVESFEQLAGLFEEMTNLLLDAVRASSLNIHAVRAWLFADPSELKNGLTPGRTFQLDEEADDTSMAKEPIQQLELGRVDGGAFTAWEGVRGMLREAASQNELRLGSLANKSEVTATEIEATSSGTEALTQHIAEDLEQQILSPMLDLVWATTLQHVSDDEETDRRLREELGDDVVEMLTTRRAEFRERTFRLRAQGISELLKMARERRALLAALEVISANPRLLDAFEQRFSVGRTLDELLRVFMVDAEKLRATPEEAQQQQVQKQIRAQEEAAQGGGAGGARSPSLSGGRSGSGSGGVSRLPGSGG